MLFDFIIGTIGCQSSTQHLLDENSKISIEISKGLKLESRQNLVCLQNQTKLTTWKSGIDIVLNYSKEPITDHFLSTFWGVSDNIVIHKYHINKWKFFNPKTFPSQDKNIKYLSDKIQIIYPLKHEGKIFRTQFLLKISFSSEWGQFHIDRPWSNLPMT